MVTVFHTKRIKMKHLAVGGCLLGILLALTLPNGSLANNDDGERDKSWSSKVTIIPSGQIINEDVFAFGERVEISGTVHGDVYASRGPGVD